MNTGVYLKDSCEFYKTRSTRLQTAVSVHASIYTTQQCKLVLTFIVKRMLWR